MLRGAQKPQALSLLHLMALCTVTQRFLSPAQAPLGFLTSGSQLMAVPTCPCRRFQSVYKPQEHSPMGTLGLAGGIGQCCSSLCSCPVRFHLLSSFPGRNSNIFVPSSRHFCESLSSNVVHLPLHLVGSHGRCLRRRRAGQACSDSPSDYFPSQLNLQIKDFLKRRLCLCVQLAFFPSVNVSGPFLNSSQFLASTRPCGGEFHSFHTPPSQMEK